LILSHQLITFFVSWLNIGITPDDLLGNIFREFCIGKQQTDIIMYS